MDLDLGCVASYVVLLEERHFGRAARRLHLSPSALTKRIQRLEQQLDTQLLVRGPAGPVSVTAGGQRFARHAERLLADVKAAEAAVGRQPPSCTVRLGVPGAIGEYPQREELQTLGEKLRRHIPGARLLCCGLPFAALTAALLDKQVDVLWTAAEVDHPGLECVPMTALWRVGVVPRTHELSALSAVDVSTFLELPLLYNPALPRKWMEQWYLGDIRPLGEAHLVEIAAQDSAAVVNALDAGMGATVVPAPLGSVMTPALHVLSLIGAPPIVFNAVRRRSDTSEPVLALIRALQSVASASVRASAPVTGYRSADSRLAGSGNTADPASSFQRRRDSSLP